MALEIMEPAGEKEKLAYYSPRENSARGGLPVHKIELEIAGQKIGYASFEYYNRPFPFYYVDTIFVDKSARGQGFGSEILNKINDYLNSKHKAGLLQNAINRKSPARKMYEEHGWTPIPGKADWFAYNLPHGIDSSRIEKAVYAANTN